MRPMQGACDYAIKAVHVTGVSKFVRKGYSLSPIREYGLMRPPVPTVCSVFRYVRQERWKKSILILLTLLHK